MKFIDKIKQLREEQSLTQRQVAAELGIDVAMYNRFEKGERSMKRELVKNLAHIYGISEDKLLTLWLAEKVYAILSEEDFAGEVISMVTEDITFNNNIRKTV
ncbi:MAG: helix-turn-helix domain-containing protein [Muribaculaceae bacterium]